MHSEALSNAHVKSSDEGPSIKTTSLEGAHAVSGGKIGPNIQQVANSQQPRTSRVKKPVIQYDLRDAD